MNWYSIVQANTPTLQFEILDADNKPIDLSVFSAIIFKMQRNGAEDANVAKACTISNVPGTDGKCYVDLTAVETENDGEYTAEVELHTAGGKVLSALQFGVSILNEVDEAKLETPVIAPIPSPLAEPANYQVAWGEIGDATAYSLEEDSGAGYVEIYNGANKYWDAVAKAAGAYFYRVKAIADYHKDSDYSEVIAVTVTT